MEFPGIRYAVTANGGRVIDLEKNEAIVEELLPHDIAEVMLDVFEHYDTFREIYFDGVGYASREALEHIGYLLLWKIVMRPEKRSKMFRELRSRERFR